MNPEETKGGESILILDDEKPILRILSRILGYKGYQADTASSAAQARQMLSLREYDLLLSDINMPGESGMDLVADIRPQHPNMAVVMISAIDDTVVAEKALSLGVYGYIIKPFEPNEILINVANALKRRALEIASHEYQDRLEREVRSRTAELEKAFNRLTQVMKKMERVSLDTIMRLSRAGEYKDMETGQHIQRMSQYAAIISREAGLGPRVARWIRYASPMHDIGKIGIPDRILTKPGPLDEEEWEIMKKHTTIGGRILSGGEVGFLRLAEVIALTHHEKWDGSGYPRGLKGREIPLAGQITALADVFDALTSERPYKPAFSPEKACEIIDQGSGSHFKPELVDIFFRLTDEFEEIRARHHDGDANQGPGSFHYGFLAEQPEPSA